MRWLRGKSKVLPGSCAHLWDGDRIVGQMEVGLREEEPDSGCIYLVYLIPEYRGRGLGRSVLKYAEASLVREGAIEARLRVSPTNSIARGLYERSGWRCESDKVDTEGLLVMQKRLVMP